MRGARCWERWMKKVYCSGTRPSWMVALLPRKKGLCGRENQAGQGDEVDGTGRRSRSSAGSSVGKCLSARSYARGSHARRSPGSPRQRPSATKTGTGDRRYRLRFRSLAPAIEEARHRVDRALPGEQSTPALRRWAQIAPLQAALDGRANQLLAWPVPTIAGASRASALHLSRLLLPRLLLDHAEALFMKYALNTPMVWALWRTTRRLRSQRKSVWIRRPCSAGCTPEKLLNPR